MAGRSGDRPELRFSCFVVPARACEACTRQRWTHMEIAMLSRPRSLSLATAALLILAPLPGSPTSAAPPRPSTTASDADAPATRFSGVTASPVTSVVPANAENVQFVGRSGGPTCTVAVQGDYADIHWWRLGSNTVRSRREWCRSPAKGVWLALGPYRESESRQASLSSSTRQSK
jgi:hypothetical protein